MDAVTAAAEGKNVYLVVMICDDTGEQTEADIAALSRTQALATFLRRTPTLVALASGRSHRFIISGSGVDVSGIFGPMVKMDEDR